MEHWRIITLVIIEVGCLGLFSILWGMLCAEINFGDVESLSVIDVKKRLGILWPLSAIATYAPRVMTI